MIPQANPKANYLAHKEEIDAAIACVLDSGQYILGKEVAAFEREFADYIGTDYAVGVASGTDALHLALRACGVGPGDEVITVSFTATATVAAIEMCGATPVLVDIDPDTYTMDIGQIGVAITMRTRAIVPVHLYGYPVNIRPLLEYGPWVIEDCAQSHGGAGGRGDIAAYSFYPTKNLGALGDGGAVVTNDPDLAEHVRLLRQYGWCPRYVSTEQGINSRLDELQAAILRVKLRHLDQDNAKRCHLARLYHWALDMEPPPEGHAHHLMVIRSKQRDELRAHLKERGIGTGVHYPMPIHLQPAYTGRVICPLPLVESERAANEVLSLPLYPELSVEEVETVAEAILDFH